MSINEDPVPPYGSASDLPSAQQMHMQIRILQMLGSFSRTKREENREYKETYDQLVSIVDSFYELLGSKNWIFTGDLNIDCVQHIIDTRDADIAEKQLIRYYANDGHISSLLRRFDRFSALAPRMTLLTKASEDSGLLT